MLKVPVKELKGVVAVHSYKLGISPKEVYVPSLSHLADPLLVAVHAVATTAYSKKFNVGAIRQRAFSFVVSSSFGDIVKDKTVSISDAIKNIVFKMPKLYKTHWNTETEKYAKEILRMLLS